MRATRSSSMRFTEPQGRTEEPPVPPRRSTRSFAPPQYAPRYSKYGFGLATQELKKPQNRAPLLTDLGGESQPKKPRRFPTNFPHQIPKRKVPKTTQRNHRERAPKITTKNNRGKHIQTLRNHAESSIHETKVRTRSSKPPDHPSLSTRSLRESLLLVLRKT
jgi:hypothetical protein